MQLGKQYAEHLFIQAYIRLLDFYRTDASTRYKQLLQRCPSIVMRLPLRKMDIITFHLHLRVIHPDVNGKGFYIQ